MLPKSPIIAQSPSVNMPPVGQRLMQYRANGSLLMSVTIKTPANAAKVGPTLACYLGYCLVTILNIPPLGRRFGQTLGLRQFANIG